MIITPFKTVWPIILTVFYADDLCEVLLNKDWTFKRRTYNAKVYRGTNFI